LIDRSVDSTSFSYPRAGLVPLQRLQDALRIERSMNCNLFRTIRERMGIEETVETVGAAGLVRITPLKRGVNERAEWVGAPVTLE
jgi:hypothetical protein